MARARSKDPNNLRSRGLRSRRRFDLRHPLTQAKSRTARSAWNMLFKGTCLLPSAPPYRQRSRNLAARQQDSVRHSDRLIPSPRSTPTSQFATNCSPKPKTFGRRQKSRAQSWQMILCRAASNRRGRPMMLNIYPKQTPFENASAAKPSETESRSSEKRWFNIAGHCAASVDLNRDPTTSPLTWSDCRPC